MRRIVRLVAGFLFVGFGVMTLQKPAEAVKIFRAKTLDIPCEFGDVSLDKTLVACGGSTESSVPESFAHLIDVSELKIISSFRYGHSFGGASYTSLSFGASGNWIFLKEVENRRKDDSVWIPSTGVVKHNASKVDRIDVMHPNGKKAFSVNDKGIEVYKSENLTTGVPSSFIPLSNSSNDQRQEIYIQKLSITQNGRFLVGRIGSHDRAFSHSDRVYVWDVESERFLYAIKADIFALSSDSTKLVTSNYYRKEVMAESGRTILLWDLASGKLLKQAKTRKEQYHDSRIRQNIFIDHGGIVSLAISPDNNLVAFAHLVADDMNGYLFTNGMGVVDMRSGKEIFYQELSSPFLAFIDNGKKLLAGAKKLTIFQIN
ncbi:hypothetical protein GTQ43_03620 [Nostoc sp. KVJ3]|uniref:WD40 repeat domain-containing protein n=1 Tax=Nostoc sp. KVJ3 TaxID=457945 RepID=UPI002237EAA0|nr:hypothetical protein [Nostoc sp. KVJ3]MCW5312970.1 hypothetical protein [Nostoc sp. KVJ3]